MSGSTSDRAPDRLAVPPALAWLRDEVGLRPPAIARVSGLGLAAFARWTAVIIPVEDATVRESARPRTG